MRIRCTLKMRSELEIAIYEEVNGAFTTTRQTRGNPLEWYCNNRVPIGYKTFTRRLAYGDWALEEVEAIQRDLKSPRIQEIMVKRFTL